MNEGEYLDFGVEINETKDEAFFIVLRMKLQKLADNPLRVVLLQGLENKEKKRVRGQSLEQCTDLKQLVGMWWNMYEVHGEEYMSFYHESENLNEQVQLSTKRVREFHRLLIQFANSEEPRELVDAFFKVHELAVRMKDEYGKEKAKWPKYAVAAPTIWSFLS